MVVSCDRCGHPGVHAAILPASGGSAGRCSGCPICEQEFAEERGRQENAAEVLAEHEAKLETMKEDIRKVEDAGQKDIAAGMRANAKMLELTIEELRRAI
jgi:hypothetical protein